jgi:hypothetical protein
MCSLRVGRPEGLGIVAGVVFVFPPAPVVFGSVLAAEMSTAIQGIRRTRKKISTGFTIQPS